MEYAGILERKVFLNFFAAILKISILILCSLRFDRAPYLFAWLCHSEKFTSRFGWRIGKAGELRYSSARPPALAPEAKTEKKVAVVAPW